MAENGSGRGPDPVLRAIGVVALVAVAAVALRARQGLDWRELTDPAGVRWIRVLAGLIGLWAVATAIRIARQRLRRRRPHASPEDAEQRPDDEAVPLLVRALGAVLVLAALTLAWYVASAIVPTGPGRPRARQLEPTGSGTAAALDTRATWTALLVLSALLLAMAAFTRAPALRRRHSLDRRQAEQADDVDDTEAAPPTARLVDAVDAGEAGLSSHDDPRRAVLAAYAAMARDLSEGLHERGVETPASDTSVELLERAAAAGLVAGRPSRELTALFREARFSTHPMGEDHRRQASQCLAEVRAGLVSRA